MHWIHIAYRSERVGKTGVSGTLLSEAKYINLSLHCLEQVSFAWHSMLVHCDDNMPQVIVALSEKSRTHIPYRNSMLTSVLRDRCFIKLLPLFTNFNSTVIPRYSCTRLQGNRHHIWFMTAYDFMAKVIDVSLSFFRKHPHFRQLTRLSVYVFFNFSAVWAATAWLQW